jgi:hypothetical protein
MHFCYDDALSDLLKLIDGEWCSPDCLFANPETYDTCTCRCGGVHHGQVRERPIPENGRLSAGRMGQREHWWEACDRGGYLALSWFVPVARTLKDEDKLWKRAREDGEPAACVRREGKRSFSVLWDGITMGLRHHEVLGLWPEREARLLNRLVHSLLEQRHIRQGSIAPCEYFDLTGFRHLDEARTVYCLLQECFHANPCGTVRALEVLEGRTDPVELGFNPEVGFPDALAYEDNPFETWKRSSS